MSELSKKLKDSIRWINTDISYKAPEQITVELFSTYVDKLMGDMSTGIDEIERQAKRITELEIIVAGNEAVTERIAELEAENKQLKIVANHVQYEQLQADNKRLRAALQKVATAPEDVTSWSECVYIAQTALRKDEG